MYTRHTFRFRQSFGVALFALILPAMLLADDRSLRLGRDVVPTFEAIELTLDADKADYRGSVSVELNVRKATNSFRFHARDLELKTVSLKGESGPVSLTYKATHDDLIAVTTDARLAPGEYTLHIDFQNEFDTRGIGLYRVEVDGHGYAFTQFEAIDARSAFPCWDEPAFKIPYQVTMTVPEGHLAVSNTPVESETVVGGSRRVVFLRSKPMPSYLLAMASGPFETVPIPGMSIPGRVITIKGASHLAGEAQRSTPPILAALEEYFGRPYPYRKLDLLAVPEYNFGAMENIGAVTYKDTILLVDPMAASESQRSRLAGTTAHELAHMWFGNLVTLAWWDDTWLNESFATWMGNKIADQVYPQYKISARQARWLQRTMVTDTRLSTRAIRQPVIKPVMANSFDELAYGKGGAVLGMFEGWMGKEVFRKGVRAYIRKHEWSNAKADDFWSALSAVAKVDAAAVMSGFFDQVGIPLVSVAVLPGGGVQLTQKRFLNFGIDAPPGKQPQWRIPVVLRWSNGKTTRTEKLLLTETTQTIRLKDSERIEWIHPNAGEKGYYRWNVPAPMMLSLVENAPALLEVRERMALAGNLAALLDAGRIAGDEYLKAIQGLAADPRPEVVGAVASALNKVQKTFVTPELEDAFAVYVRHVLGPVLDRIGLTRVDGEEEAVSMLRPTLLSWLGEEGRDRDVLRFAGAIARKYVESPTSVDAAIAGTCLKLSALQGNRTLYDTYRKKFESARVPAERSRFLRTLGSFRDPAIVSDVLAYCLAGPLRSHELLTIPFSVASSPRYRDRIFRWMMDNYDAITSRMPPESAAFLPHAASGCSSERLAAGRKFFSDPAHSVPGTARQLAKVAEGVTDCLALREREGPAAAKYLRREYSGP